MRLACLALLLPLLGCTTDDTEHDDGWRWPQGTTLVLRDVTVVDSLGAAGPVTVVVAEGRIAAVDAAIPDNTPEVAQEVVGGFVTPGLVDPHVHLFLPATPWPVGDTLTHTLRAWPYFGVTSVVDAGGPTVVFDLRDRIEGGEVFGPSVKATGPFVTAPLSHPCELFNDPTRCWYAEDATEGAALGRDLVSEEADGIKISLTDADFTPWPTPRLDLAAAAAAVGPVAAAGGLVYAHVAEQIDAKEALDVGAEHLAHPVFAEELSQDALWDLATFAASTHTTVGAFAGPVDAVDGALPLAELAVVLAPGTIAAMEDVAADPDLLDPTWLAESQLWTADARTNLGLLREFEATIVPASDGGYAWVPPGWALHRELAELEAMGWTRQEVLTAATETAAELTGWTDRGRVADGLRADLLVLEEDPLSDLTALSRPTLVILGGEVLERDAIPDLDVLRVTENGTVGTFCVDDRDCASGACDLVDHRCGAACDTAWDSTADCGAAAYCAPAEAGVDTEAAVCHDPGRTCPLYAEEPPCEPLAYNETCVPRDLDTNACWPAGPRGEGESCSWEDPLSEGCGAGMYCSPVDATCYILCDPALGEEQYFVCEHKLCTTQSAGDEDWFGLCI